MKKKAVCHMENMPRLNRISGQINGVKKMIEDNRPCVDILMQIKAVRSALKAVESNILQKHLGACVAELFEKDKNPQKQINELQALFDQFRS